MNHLATCNTCRATVAHELCEGQCFDCYSQRIHEQNLRQSFLDSTHMDNLEAASRHITNVQAQFRRGSITVDEFLCKLQDTTDELGAMLNVINGEY